MTATCLSPADPAATLLPQPRGAGEARFNEAMRVCPHAFLRSSVFGLVSKGRREHLDDRVLAATDAFIIRFTGLQLDQSDLDVWLALVHLLKYEPTGCAVTTTHLELLALLGKADSGQNRQALQKQLARLRATVISVHTPAGVYIGGLIDAAVVGKKLSVRLEPRITELFAGKRFARMQAVVRDSLPPFGKWLYGYFCSHIQPAPIAVDEIRRLCGSATADLDDFRTSLRTAMRQVELACAAHEENFNWRIDRTGQVHVNWIDSLKYARWVKKSAPSRLTN